MNNRIPVYWMAVDKDVSAFKRDAELRKSSRKVVDVQYSREFTRMHLCLQHLCMACQRKRITIKGVGERVILDALELLI